MVQGGSNSQNPSMDVMLQVAGRQVRSCLICSHSVPAVDERLPCSACNFQGLKTTASNLPTYNITLLREPHNNFIEVINLTPDNKTTRTDPTRESSILVYLGTLGGYQSRNKPEQANEVSLNEILHRGGRST